MIKVVAVAVILAALLRNISIPGVIGHLRIEMLIGMLAMQPILAAGLGINAFRFVLLVDTPRIPVWTACKALLLSLGLNAILPARFSEILKATYIRDHSGVALSQGLAAVFLERVVDVFYLGILATVATSLLLTNAFGLAVSLIAPVVILLIVIVTLKQRLLALAQRMPWVRLRNFSVRFIRHITSCLKNRAFYGALAVGAFVWIASCTSVVLFLSWVGSIPIGIGGAIIVFIASTIGGAIPALPGGVGTYEAAVALTLKGFGYDIEEAIALGIALHAGQLLLSFTAALIIVTVDRTGVRALLRDVLAEHPKPPRANRS